MNDIYSLLTFHLECISNKCQAKGSKVGFDHLSCCTITKFNRVEVSVNVPEHFSIISLRHKNRY